MFQPCTYGQWISSLSHSVSMTTPCPNSWRVTSPKPRNREDRKRKSSTLTGISPNSSTHRTGSSFRTERGIRLQGAGKSFNQKLYVSRCKAEPSKGGTAHHHASQQTDDSAGERQKVHVHARLPLLVHTLQSLHFIPRVYILGIKRKWLRNVENRFTLLPYSIYTKIK